MISKTIEMITEVFLNSMKFFSCFGINENNNNQKADWRIKSIFRFVPTYGTKSLLISSALFILEKQFIDAGLSKLIV